ncbi:AGAP001991-PA [Anopheles gambiae str. PEST]|uniref:AGAP001991-PA n=1 Tax=Anopheles gambiae TaxID=7165 RepID=A0NHB4_ANOGA|nr:AGAP001991-PA [Anopheles gambiae str. PEST]
MKRISICNSCSFGHALFFLSLTIYPSIRLFFSFTIYHTCFRCLFPPKRLL